MRTKVVYKEQRNSETTVKGGRLVLASRISHFVNYPWVIQELLGSGRNRP